MAFGTLDGVKKWLNISTTDYDTELNEILDVVDTYINLMVYKWFSHLSDNEKKVLGEIENKWAAGIFLKRRNPADSTLLEEAKDEFRNFLKERSEFFTAT